ncbi:MAG: glycoside hydrolase family 97 C-terminal domain-containing protein, partial [Pseudomonadota bacterium]|nr:glycoside hydrolase family 97 C-terminal domain-containing protein [Pseudomonadota bacterium]
SGKAPDHADFTIRFNRPMSQTTRVHQMAMFTVFESPLQMMADSPTQYLDNPECAEFIASVPSVWDESIALNGQIGDYVTFARRSGSEWFVGAMTDEHARKMNIDLDFLPAGRYDIVIFQDGINAHRFAEDFKKVTKTVTHRDSLTMQLAPGGGFTARITPRS